MYRFKVKMIPVWLTAVLLLAACTPWGDGPAEPTLIPRPTEVKPTIAVPTTEPTETAVPPPTATLPPATPTVPAQDGTSPPAPDPSVPPTPIPSQPTGGPTSATALTSVNVRRGPGLGFEVVDWLEAGDVVELNGKNFDGEWWEILCDVVENGRCWITALPQYVEAFTPTDAPPGHRLQFDPGTYSLTQLGTVERGEQHDYLLHALAGQVLEMRILGIQNRALFSVLGVDDGLTYKTIADGDYIKLVLPRTQDYAIAVSDDGQHATYALGVAVFSSETDPEPIRIALHAGEKAATLTGHANPFRAIDYLAGVQAGQTVHVSLSAPTSDAVFWIFDPINAQTIAEATTFWSGTLPATQDYIISVLVPNELKGSHYVLDVVFEPLQPEIPVHVDPGSPPSETCIAVHPGGPDAIVPILLGPHHAYNIIAYLGNWAEVVKIENGYAMVTLGPGSLGWVNVDIVTMVGCEGS
ncbi:MAG: SH3 domain-containing protein [Chloroflexota bacterium]